VTGEGAPDEQAGGPGPGGDDPGPAPPAPREGAAAEEDHADAGLDLARDVSRATAAGGAPSRRRARGRARPADGPGPAGGRVSGAHPDERDPQSLDVTVGRLVRDHGWDLDLRVHAVFGRWEELVGPQVGGHSRPEAFEDGRLVVRTDSTAWATQLRLLAPTVVRRLNEELGHGTVLHLEVLGPHGPTWKKGRLSARDGRGPRDTYG
jgi:predicted nucleic acid-binding Zn ribbon protein